MKFIISKFFVTITANENKYGKYSACTSYMRYGKSYGKKIDMFHILATFTQERKKMVVFYK